MISRGAVQKALTPLWLEVLDRPSNDTVVEQENFFEFGGDSLAAIMLHEAIGTQLKIGIEFADVLDVLAGGDFGALTELVGQAVEAAADLDPLHPAAATGAPATGAPAGTTPIPVADAGTDSCRRCEEP
jgi:hypothetical protein